MEENYLTTSKGTIYYANPHTELTLRGDAVGDLDRVASLVDQVVEGLRERAVEGLGMAVKDEDDDPMLDKPELVYDRIVREGAQSVLDDATSESPPVR